MKTFEVRTEWAGYSRGGAVYRVEAESKEEAMEEFCGGERVKRYTNRDDTEEEACAAEEITHKEEE